MKTAFAELGFAVCSCSCVVVRSILQRKFVWYRPEGEGRESSTKEEGGNLWEE